MSTALCRAGRSGGKPYSRRVSEFETRAGSGQTAACARGARRSRRRPRLPPGARPRPRAGFHNVHGMRSAYPRCLPGTGAARRGPVVSGAVARAAERSERPPRTPQPGAREPELPGTRGCPTRGPRGFLCPRPLTREPRSRARLQPVAGRGNSWGWGGQLGREGGTPFSSSQ